MKRKRFSDEQIFEILRLRQAGTRARRLGALQGHQNLAGRHGFPGTHHHGNDASGHRRAEAGHRL